MKETKLIISGAAFIIAFGIISNAVVNSSVPEVEAQGSWACTADVNICPDGSIVQRVPPYCRFALCDKQ